MMRRIETVQAMPGYRLRIGWDDGRHDVVDMTGVVEGLALLAPLKEVPAFADVRVVAYGSGIEWGDGSLDYSADSLECLAEDQRPMTGADFRRWKQEMGLSLRETADLFGMATSTVKIYLASQRELPVAFQIACLAMKRDRQVLLARFRPRITGRPRRSPDSAAA